MIEIQIVPSDIRRRVRYFFFDRRRVVIGICALSIILAGCTSALTAPAGNTAGLQTRASLGQGGRITVQPVITPAEPGGGPGTDIDPIVRVRP